MTNYSYVFEAGCRVCFTIISRSWDECLHRITTLSDPEGLFSTCLGDKSLPVPSFTPAACSYHDTRLVVCTVVLPERHKAEPIQTS